MSLSQNAGFTTGSTPWMRTMDSYKEINVAVQENDSTSVLAFYRQLLNLRKEHKHVLVHGRFELVSPDNEQTMIYIKKSDNSKAVAVVALNFSWAECGHIWYCRLMTGSRSIDCDTGKALGKISATNSKSPVVHTDRRITTRLTVLPSSISHTASAHTGLPFLQVSGW